jgi:hypothetical protein
MWRGAELVARAVVAAGRLGVLVTGEVLHVAQAEPASSAMVIAECRKRVG